MLSVNKRLFIPNAVSGANIASGFLSMLAASNGRFEMAVYLLLLAIILDTMDGRVARRLNATSKFGQEMDSFSDALSFCAAPAFLIFKVTLYQMRGLGVAIAVFYLLAGVYRLARFNLMSDEHSKATRTLGVPTPVGAGYLMALALMSDRMPAELVAAVVVVMGLLMVSRIQLPELHGRGLVAIALLIGMCNFIFVVFRPNWYTVGWWNVWNAVIVLLARAEDRRYEATEVT